MQPRKPDIRSSRAVVATTALLCVLALAGKPGSASAAAPCPGASDAPGRTATGELVDATLCLLNRERRQSGLDRLRLSGRLTIAAQAHSGEMVARQYFDHVTPGGMTPSDRVGATGYLASTRAWAIGENIMWGTLTLDTPEAAVAAWMKSPEHRANILYAPYREIGIGVAVGDPVGIAGPAATYTTDFGQRETVRARRRARGERTAPHRSHDR